MAKFKIFLFLTGLLAFQNALAQSDTTRKMVYQDTSLGNKMGQSIKDSLAHRMMNEPAPLFTLIDLAGKTIALKDLRSKIVVIDFWATWCPPCKASMPALQMVVNKYRKNAHIQFLFIDCGERATNYSDLVKNFIADNQYKFQVLLDEKGDDGKQTKVLNAYKIDGIPTKFVIDRKGNIRFKSVGYSGNPDTLVDEVSAMIELVN